MAGLWRRRWIKDWGWWLPAWVVGGVLLHLLVPPLEQALPEATGGFLPDDSGSVLAAKAFSDAFSETEKSNATLIVRRAGGLTADDFAFLDRVTAALEKQRIEGPSRGIPHAWPSGLRSPSSRYAAYNPVLRDKLISRDGQAAIVVVLLPFDIVSIYAIHAIRNDDKRPGDHDMHGMIEDAKPPAGLEHHITGSAALGRDYALASKESLDRSLLWTLAGIILVLLFVYRSPAAVIISLVTVSFAVAVSFRAASVLALLNLPVSATAKQFLIVLLYGAGTDFCLFLFARYREELGRRPASADDPFERLAIMARALRVTAPAVLASAATTSIALGTMVFARFGAYSSAGPALALGLLIATAAALTLAPALMLLCGRGLFWPGVRLGGTGTFGGLWDKLSHIPARYPVGSIVAVLGVFVPFFFVIGRTPQVFDSLQDLPADSASRMGAEVFRNHFAPGDAFPVAVLIKAPRPVAAEGARIPDDAVQLAIENAAAALRAMPAVRDVRSLRDPFGFEDRYRLEGDPPGKVDGSKLTHLPPILREAAARTAEQAAIAKYRIVRNVILGQAAPVYIGTDRRSIRLDIILKDDVTPYSRTALDTVKNIKAALDASLNGTPLQGAEIFALGTTPTMEDIRAVTGADFKLVALLVGISLMAVLLVLLRDWVLSSILILATAAGYFATLGLTASLDQLVFGMDGLDWKVEFFLFCILVAIGQDYNIFIISRILEEAADPELAGPDRPERAVRRAVMRTGGIISCCGVVMAVTFASMMSAPLNAMRQIGFALTAGVLIDTFVIRPLLVPAAYVLLERFRSRKSSETKSEIRNPKSEGSTKSEI